MTYIEAANANIFAAVMIETVAAVEAIEQIVAIDGLDSIVITSTRNAGTYVGSGMPADANFAYTQARRGVHWVQLGVDCSYLTQFMDQVSTDIRQKLAD